MAYSKNQIKTLFDKIYDRIVNGESLSSILRDNDMPSRSTFYIWIKEDDNLSNKYARATSIRADVIFTRGKLSQLVVGWQGQQELATRDSLTPAVSTHNLRFHAMIRSLWQDI